MKSTDQHGSSGGRTLWANFYYSVLSIDLSVVRDNPHQSNSQSGPGRVAHVVGWKLCSHKVFMRIFSVGKEQMFIAMVNVW